MVIFIFNDIEELHTLHPKRNLFVEWNEQPVSKEKHHVMNGTVHDQSKIEPSLL
jgi:hypothetical protein